MIRSAEASAVLRRSFFCSWTRRRRLGINVTSPQRRGQSGDEGGLDDLIGTDRESRQRVGAEDITDWNVGGIAPAGRCAAGCCGCHGVPVSTNLRLEPRGEVHRLRSRGHADVAEITGAIASRYVEAAAERDGQMREVSADALALVQRLQRGAGRACVLIAERSVLVHNQSSCLLLSPLPKSQMARTRPTPVGPWPKRLHATSASRFRFAVAAAKQKTSTSGGRSGTAD